MNIKRIPKYTLVFLSFMSNLVKEFLALFPELAEISMVSQLLKLFYEIAPGEKWTEMVAKLFRLEKPLFQMDVIYLQRYISLQMFKTSSPEEFLGQTCLRKV